MVNCEKYCAGGPSENNVAKVSKGIYEDFDEGGWWHNWVQTVFAPH